MIGKPEWFGRRKYSGWGITPKVWQGWVYLVATLVPIAILQAVPLWSMQVRLIGMAIWGIFLAVDITDIMVHLKKDEREVVHEAIAERNAAWFMIMVLAIGLAFETSRNLAQGKGFTINPFIAAALIGGLVVKAATNIYLEHRS